MGRIENGNIRLSETESFDFISSLLHPDSEEETLRTEYLNALNDITKKTENEYDVYDIPDLDLSFLDEKNEEIICHSRYNYNWNNFLNCEIKYSTTNEIRLNAEEKFDNNFKTLDDFTYTYNPLKKEKVSDNSAEPLKQFYKAA